MPKSLPDELYHYTGTHGLKGIIESQTLWATHYKSLNDAEEITHFRDRLPDILRPVFKNMFSRLNPKQKQLLLDEYRSIDIALKEEPKKLATIMYNVTFAGTKNKSPIAEPYITSFCTVDKTDKRIANHGLLSQWRGYGAQGGYVIIFDTEGLIQLLHEEGKNGPTQRFSLGTLCIARRQMKKCMMSSVSTSMPSKTTGNRRFVR